MESKRRFVFLLTLSLMTTACGGGSGDGNVGLTDPDDELRGLTIKGRTIEPEAQVRVVIGNEEVGGKSDSSGNFEVLIPEEFSDGMVSIQTDGSDSRAGVRLMSVLGMLKSLESQAGDNVLTASENPRLHVNEISTALYAVLDEMTTENEFLDEDVLASVERHYLDGQWVLYSAAAIRTAMENQALLGDYADTLELAKSYRSSKAVAHGFESATTSSKSVSLKADDGLDPSVRIFVDATRGLLNGPDRILEFKAEFLPAEYRMIGMNPNLSRNAGKVLRFNDDGTGTMVTATGTHATTWSIDNNGVLTIRPDDGLAETMHRGATSYETHATEIKYFLINEGAHSDLVVESVTSQVNFLTDGVRYQTVETEDIYAFTAVKPGMHSLWSSDEVTGSWALPGVNRRIEPNVEAHVPQDAVFEFMDSGTGSVNGEDFTWQIDSDGNLLVTFVDGSVNKYVKLTEQLTEIGVLALGTDLTTGVVGFHANGGLAVKIEYDLSPAESVLTGRYALFGDNYLAYDLYAGPEMGLVYEVESNGRMVEFGRDDDGNFTIPDLDYARYWEPAGDSLRSDLLFDRTSGEVNWACTGGVPNCVVNNDFVWHFLRQDGNRLYVLQESATYDYPEGPDGPKNVDYGESRLLWWQMQDPL